MSERKKEICGEDKLLNMKTGYFGTWEDTHEVPFSPGRIPLKEMTQ